MLKINNRLKDAIILALGVAVAPSLLGATPTAKSRLGGFQPSRNPQERIDRVQRVQQMGLNQVKLAHFIARYRKASRENLTADGHLTTELPPKGSAVLGARHRTDQGNRLLLEAKDMLFALLFGDEKTRVHFDRVERELLTLTVPRAKVRFLEFMKASTEISGAGTWQDPEDIANDERADNVIIEVEYGETRDEIIGDGIVTALRLINLLEVNEQVLYARMANVEQSTLMD